MVQQAIGELISRATGALESGVHTGVGAVKKKIAAPRKTTPVHKELTGHGPQKKATHPDIEGGEFPSKVAKQPARKGAEAELKDAPASPLPGDKELHVSGAPEEKPVVTAKKLPHEEKSRPDDAPKEGSVTEGHEPGSKLKKAREEGPELVSIDRETHAELLKFWDDKIQAETNPKTKAMYQRFKERHERNERPAPLQSEMEMAHLHSSVGGQEQQGYRLGRKAVKKLERGSTRPDVVMSGALVEVKNFSITNEKGLIKKLKKQVDDRREHGPVDIKAQTVVIDFRGQSVTKEQAVAFTRRVAKAVDLPVRNFQVVLPRGLEQD